VFCVIHNLRPVVTWQAVRAEAATVDDDLIRAYPWLAERDERFTLALVLDVGEVLTRHGYEAPVGGVLVDLTAGLYRALHPDPPIHRSIFSD
jgi:hypothetical protein